METMSIGGLKDTVEDGWSSLKAWTGRMLSVAGVRPVRESVIEKRLVRRCRESGIYCRKWASPGQRGVPDRILLYDGKWFAVELKAPGKKPTKLQTHEILKIRKQGGHVLVIDCEEDVDWFIENRVLGR